MNEQCYLEIDINGAMVACVVRTNSSYGSACWAHIKKSNVVTFNQYNSGFRRAVFYPKLAQ